jgi:hypothetical protein
MKDADNGIDKEPPVMILVMGVDKWRSEADWSLPTRPPYPSGGISQ